MRADLPSFISHPDPTIYLGDNYVVLDYETTNREHGSALDRQNALVLACWRLGRGHAAYTPGGTNNAYAKWGDEFSQGELEAHLRSAQFFVAHNTKFELGWLKRCGVDLRKLLPYDTMIGEKVLAGNRRVELSLQATAGRRGMGSKEAAASALIKSGVSSEYIPATMLESYCHQDVTLTERVFVEQRKEVAQAGLLPVAFCRNVVTPVLADIEPNGMALDPERVAETYADYSARYGELTEKFSQITDGINPKSPKQMGAYLYDKMKFEELTDFRGKVLRTPKTLRNPEGGRKTDKDTLALLKATTPAQKAFMKVAKALKLLSTPMQNLTKMQEIIKARPDDPRVFAEYNQTVTQTDRLSSTGRNGGFQFHNFDRAFKRLFCARQNGRVMCEADAPQLEFRVATLLGHDAVAKRDILDGVDVHAITAATIGVSRQDAKPFTFKPLYGGNSGTPRQRKYFDYFRNRYEGIYRTQESWTMSVARDKVLTTPWGLKFYWPNTEISKSGYVTNTTQIFNYPIQSFATADIIPLVLVLVWHRISALSADDCLLVNTIHDSIIAEISEEIYLTYSRILVECFTHDIYELVKGIYGITIDVPLGVGIKHGKFWGEGAEQKFEPSACFRSAA